MVCRLGIPYKKDDFHCPEHCDNLLSHVTLQPVKPKVASTMSAPELEYIKPMVIPIEIRGSPVPGNLRKPVPNNLNNTVKAQTMVDCTARTQFIDQEFKLNLKVKLNQKVKPDTLIVVDGCAGNLLNYTCTLNETIDQHLQNLTFQVMKLGSQNMILGQSGLKEHNPTID